jgi:hypothetical protein
MGFFNVLKQAGIELGQAGIRNVDDLIRNVVLPIAERSGDPRLVKGVTKEANGLIGESPQAVNQAIDAVRRSQAPAPRPGGNVEARSPFIPQTSPVAPIGPRTPGGAIVPVNPQAAPAFRPEIPSEPFPSMRPTVENVSRRAFK